MIVRSLHLDDRGGIAHVDVRMTAEEARLLVDISAALATALGQQQHPAPAEEVTAPEPRAVVTPLPPRRPRRRLTDRELAAAIDAILDREPSAGRPRVREALASRGFAAGKTAHLARILKARKRARLRAMSLPLEA
jgi:hypothetical protein